MNDGSGPSKQQTIERHYFEMFRKVHQLPLGIITHGDKPDVLVIGTQRIGIEMTVFYVMPGASPSSEQVQCKLREVAVAKAHRLYQQNAGKNIGLTVSFDKRHPIQNVGTLAKRLAVLARRIEDRDNGQISRAILEDFPEINFAYLQAHELQYSAESDPLFPDGQPDLSEGFAAWAEYRNRREARALREGIYKPLQSPAIWKVSHSHDFGLMSIERLTELIREKEVKARQYAKCDAYWLLIVVDFLDPAQEQEIRIEGFTIESEVFQKIIIYKPYFEHVVEITRQLASVQSG